MSSVGLPHFKLASLADKHDPIFTIRLGVHRALVVSSSKFIKEMFTTCDMAVSNRPKLRIGEHLAYNFAMFGFSPYGPYWKPVRKLTSAELLSARRVELQRNARMSETNYYVRNLYEVWENERDESGRVLVDMKKWLGDLNLNMVLRLVAGKRFDDEEEMRRCEEVFREFFRLGGMFVTADALMIDLLHLDETLATPMRFDGDETACVKHATERLRVSWILIDPVKRRAVNVASGKPVEAQWLTEGAVFRFGTVVVGGDGEMVRCGVVVTCGGKDGGDLILKEVSMQVEDTEDRVMEGQRCKFE